MVVGSIWYMPSLFGNRWMELAQVDPDQAAERGALPIVVTVIVSLVSAYVLAVLAPITLDYYGGGFLGNTVLIGLTIRARFTAARIITHDAFEGRPIALTTMNIAHELVTVLVMALIIGAFGVPS